MHSLREMEMGEGAALHHYAVELTEEVEWYTPQGSFPEVVFDENAMGLIRPGLGEQMSAVQQHTRIRTPTRLSAHTRGQKRIWWRNGKRV
jgi:hypothetical protein